MNCPKKTKSRLRPFALKVSSCDWLKMTLDTKRADGKPVVARTELDWEM